MNDSKIYVVEGAIKPVRSRPGDAGIDLAVQKSATVLPGETKILPAGVKFDISPGYAVHVITRSGTNAKTGATIVPTIVDYNFHGEISILVSNFTKYPIEIERGMFLAQAVLMPYYSFVNEFEEIGRKFDLDDRSDTDAFGSSGLY